MRIAFYAPLKAPTHPVPSGDRRMARLLIDLLKAAGHEVELASELRSYAMDETVAVQEAIRERGETEARRLLDRWRGQPRARPDLWFTYHLYYRAPDWIGPSVASVLAIPYVVAEASYATKRADGPWAIGHAQTALALAHAAVIFCLSQVDRPALAKVPGFKARLVDLAPFVDTGGPPAIPREQARSALGLTGEAPVILTVAMMRTRAKRESYRLLAEALARITDRPWRLVVAGDGPDRAEVERLLNPLGRERVVWLGAVEGEYLRRAYAAADLFAWPGVDEAYGMVYLEAQAAGLPVVAMAYAGVANVVADGISGRLAGAGDVAAFADALAGLSDDPVERTRLGESARRWVGEARSMSSARDIVSGALAALKITA